MFFLTQLDGSLRSFSLDLGALELEATFWTSVNLAGLPPCLGAYSSPPTTAAGSVTTTPQRPGEMPRDFCWDLDGFGDAFGGTSMMIRDDFGFKHAETWEVSEISSFKHPPQKILYHLPIPICPEIRYFNLKENPLSKPSKEAYHEPTFPMDSDVSFFNVKFYLSNWFVLFANFCLLEFTTAVT